MISTPVESLVVRQSAAHFAGAQGYRLEGDQAHLNAAVTVDDAAPAGADWALQLWACEQGAGDGALQGIKVAELALGNLWANGTTSLEGWATALPPAGQCAHTMVLALASGRPGLFDQIHDLAVFPMLENFLQPALQGGVGYRFGPGSVELNVDAVSNPRDGGNLSGSLILELWALPRPYQGGAFEGFQIGTAELGCLAGQASFQGVQVAVPAALVPAGTWQVVLMLREWTPAGYVTRDYANFAEPLVVAELVAETAPAAVEVAEAAAPVAEVAIQPVVTKPVAAETSAKATPAEPVKSVAPVKATPAPAKTAEAVKPAAVAKHVEAVKPAESAKTKAVEPEVVKAAPVAKAAAPGQVSINRASVGELAAVKGVTKTLAAAIVASRPYATLDDVLKAKGMGAKLLEKLRKHLSV